MRLAAEHFCPWYSKAPRTIKETFVPATDFAYPFLREE